MRIDTDTLAVWSREESLRRNAIFETFFKAEACHEISRRFLAVGLHHPARSGTVTVSGKPGVDVPPVTLNSILKQTGLKWKRKVMQYTVIIEKGENSFGAYVPDLPGCVAVGETREEVLRLIQEAIEFHLEGMKEGGLTIPEPTSTSSLVEVMA